MREGEQWGGGGVVLTVVGKGGAVVVGNGSDRENGRERERLGEGEGWERGRSGDRAVGKGHWEAELLGEPLGKHKI